MKVLVTGATGCAGRAVVHALRARGHKVVEGSRGGAAERHGLAVDYAQPTTPAAWAERLRPLGLDAVVNCVGILMPSRGQTFERIHTEGPIELFRGAALAGVRRVVQVSALGVSESPEALDRPYLASKLKADDALAALPLEWAVLRPSLLYGPGSQSAALFATLASLPAIGLPGLGRQRVQPLHVFELAEAVARLLEQPNAPQAVLELGGAESISYREMLARYRDALGLPAALWLPVPMPLMHALAWGAEALPQKVFCRDTIAMLERGSVPAVNALPALLGRTPSTLAHGLGVTAPQPMLDLAVRLSPAVAAMMRASLALMWVFAALAALCLPESSGLARLTAQPGLEGPGVGVAMLLPCLLALGLGVLAWRPRTAWAWPLQLGTVLVGTAAVALGGGTGAGAEGLGAWMLGLPVMALILALWLAASPLPMRKAGGAATGVRAGVHRRAKAGV